MPAQYRCTSVILNIILFNLPVIRNFISESTFHVAVQQIVTNICSGSFHPFNMNWSLRDIEIIREKLGWRRWSLPMKLFGDVSPEFLRSIDRTFVHISVLLHGANVGFPWHGWIWHKHRFPHLVFYVHTLTTTELVSQRQEEFLRDTTQRSHAVVQTNYARSSTYISTWHNTQR